jgi:hypothetical protein
MLWHLLLVFVSPLASVVLGLLHDERNRQILALRQHVLILRPWGPKTGLPGARRSELRPSLVCGGNVPLQEGVSCTCGVLCGRRRG